jgi:ATP synthase F1 delta subunit
VGSSYAAALVELAQSKNALEAIHSDVDTLSSMMRDNEALVTFMTNPVATPEKKNALIKKIAQEGGFNNYTTNFLMLLVEKNRIDAIADIIAAFEELYCRLTDTQVRSRYLTATFLSPFSPTLIKGLVCVVEWTFGSSKARCRGHSVLPPSPCLSPTPFISKRCTIYR